MKVILIAVCIAVGYASAATFPSDIQKCSYGDEACLLTVVNSILQTKADGHSGINLLPLDPITINSIKISQGGNSALNLDLDLTNIRLSGMSGGKMTSIKGFQSDPNGEYVIKMSSPRLVLDGPYKSKGRILAFPLDGKGDANFTLDNVESIMSFTGRGIDKNGQTYLQLDKFKLEFDVSRFYIDLSNLFNGDKALLDTTNKFLNDNWRDIFDELKPSIFDAFGLVLKQIIQNVFNKLPYKEMFAQ